MEEILLRRVLRDEIRLTGGLQGLENVERFIRNLMYEYPQYKVMLKVASDISFMNCRISIPSDILRCNLDVDDYENIRSLSFMNVPFKPSGILIEVDTNYNLSDLGFKKDVSGKYWLGVNEEDFEDHLYKMLSNIKGQEKGSNDKIDYVLEYLEEERKK